MNDKNYYLSKLDLFPFPVRPTDISQVENRKLTEEELTLAQQTFTELLNDAQLSPHIHSHARQLIMQLHNLPELGIKPTLPLLFITTYNVVKDLEGIDD